MNPIPLRSETFSPVAHRPDAHSIRYEFRHLVNAGVLRLAQYENFVALVDTSGSVNAAVARLRSGEILA
jgi:hypothetical protein